MGDEKEIGVVGTRGGEGHFWVCGRDQTKGKPEQSPQLPHTTCVWQRRLRPGAPSFASHL